MTAQATVGADGNYLVENVNVESLTDGPLTIDAVATDNNGNTIEADTSAVLDAVESALSVNATVDNDAATLDISGSTTDVPENGVVNITITDQNDETVTAQATVDADGNYSVADVDVSELTDGPLTIDAVATDNNGNPVNGSTTAELDAVESALNVNASVDNDAATLDISGSTTDVAEGTVVAITITDQNDETVTAQATVDADGNYSVADVDVSELTDGPLTIDAVATDNNGNPVNGSTTAELDAVESALNVNASVDNDAATLDISGSTTDVAEGTVVAITITDQNDETVTAQATVDADGNYSVADVDVSELTDGPLTIDAVATDNNGNPVNGSTTAELDAVESALNVNASVDNDAATLDISGSTTDVAEGTVVAITITDQNDETVTAQATVDADGNYSVADVDVSELTDGPLTIDAVATDNNGNPVNGSTTAELDAVESALNVNASVDNDAATLDISGSTTDVAEGTVVAITITDQNDETVTAQATVDADGNYSVADVDVSELTDGPLTIDAVATDNNGNPVNGSTTAELDAVESALNVNASVDNDAATLDISGSTTDVAEGTVVAITITDQNDETVTAQATVDADGNYSVADVDVSELTDGPLTIDAVATDNNGNPVNGSTTAELDAVESALNVNASVDNDAATLDISGSTTDVAEGTVVAITITDQNDETVTAQATVDADGNYSVADVDVSELTDGPLTIDAVATDNNGNPVNGSTTAELDAVESALNVNASVDNDAATLDISGSTTDVAEGTVVAITITDQNDETVTAQATVDADGNYSVADVDVSELTDGPLTIDAVATDNNGNPVNGSTTAELDAVESALNVNASVDNDAATLDISGSTTDVAEGTVVAITITDQNDETVTAQATVDADGNYSVADVDVSELTDGPLTIDAVATDNNGNPVNGSTTAELDAVESALNVNASVDNDAATLDISGSTTDVAEGTVVAITITDQNDETVTAQATVDADGNYSVADVDVSELTDGPLTIDAVATDNNGNPVNGSTTAELDAVESALNVNASVDNDAATLDISGSTTDVAEGTVVAITITDQNDETVTAQATVDADGNYSVADVDVSELTDGPLTIDAVATDNNGNPVNGSTTAELDAVESALNVNASVDNDAATLDISGSTTDVAEGTVVAITITDQNDETVTAQATVDADGNYSVADVDVSELTDGPLTIDAVATDNNGNPVNGSTTAELDAVESALNVNASVDNDAATLDISGSTTDVAEGTVVAITITDQNDETVTAQATVDADGNYSVADVDVSELTDGPLTIDAVATDNNGNPVNGSTTAELDAVESALNVNASVDNDAATLDISGSTTDVAEGTVVAITITDQNDETVTAQATVDADGNYSVADVDVSELTDGPLTIDAVATDNNGNPVNGSTTAELDAVESALNVNASVDNDAATLDISGSTTDVAEGTVVAITITDQNDETVTAQATVDADGNYSVADVDVSELTDGPLTIDAVATDNNGNPVNGSTTAELDAVESALNVNASVDNDAATLDISGSTTDVAEGTVVAITITDQNDETVTAQATVDADGNYSVADVDVSELTDGPLTIDAVATDNNGNPVNGSTTAELDAVESALNVNASVDNDAATLDISGSTTDVAEGTVVAITITDQNDETVTAQATVDADGNYSVADVDVSELTDGPLTIDAVATDNNGNPVNGSTTAELDAVESALNVNASVDNDAATLDISGSTTDVAEGTVVAITITDTTGATVTAEATVQADGSYSIDGVDVSSLQDGLLTIEAVATDNNGNEIEADTSTELDAVESALSVNASVDNDAATLDISGSTTDVAEGQVVALTITDTTGATVTAEATVQADGSYSIDGVDVSSLQDGLLTIEAVATDNNGNEIEADTSTELDAVESALSVNASVDNDAATLDISGSTTDVAEGQVVALTITDTTGATVTAEATVQADGSYSIDGVDVSSLQDGLLTIEAVATDNNGNEIEADTSTELDAVESALSVVAAVNHADAIINIRGSSEDVPANSEVTITITDQNGNTVTATAIVNMHGDYSVANVDVSGLVDGELTIIATATDNNGNQVDADTYVELDTTPPTLRVDAPDSNDTTPTITGTSDEIGAMVTVVVTDANNVEQTLTAVVLADGTWSAEVTTPLAEGVYDVGASVSDVVGNVATAETTGEIDLTPPVIAFDDLPTNTNNTMPDITGTSDEIGATVTVVVTDANGVEQTVTGVVQTDGTWSVSLVRPLSVGDYTAKASVSDAVGNEATAEADAPGLILPSVSITDFALREEEGVEVTSLIWDGELSNSQFGVTTELANTNNGVTGRLTNNDVARTINLSITSVDGSNSTALMAVGDTYLVSWQTVNRSGQINGNFEEVMAVTRSDYFSFTGEARDILVLQGTVNGNLVSVVIDSNGVQTGSYGWFGGWSGTEYIINDLYDTDVGFREFSVNGTGMPNSSVEIFQIDESGNEQALGTTTIDANGNWNFDVGSLVGRTGQLKVNSVDQFGNESTDIKDFIFGETNIANTLEGGEGDDLIVGGLQDDTLRGGDGDDILYGEAGNDILIGGAGNDILIGGDGNDIFLWEAGDEGEIGNAAVDVVRDFGNGDNALDIRQLLDYKSEDSLADYIVAEQEGDDTVLYLNSEGNLGSDKNNADQVIRLEGKSFADFGGADSSSQDVIQYMINNGKLDIE
ncbi:Ig-like domain-containing protein [Halomonas sp. M1]|uniref:beta strand repeat-containing protein n=1 Tax=Halomonas sp. M1 TaxID=3035470 RepID=UPI002485DAE3|nr:Ig-like domain-containing protein [Halomonas sp. M1]WFE71382.1 Ig-like domain-containing protein [Halomonas sp. M1]